MARIARKAEHKMNPVKGMTDEKQIRELFLKHGVSELTKRAGYMPAITDSMLGVEEYGRENVPPDLTFPNGEYFYEIIIEEPVFKSLYFDYKIWNGGKNVSMYDGSDLQQFWRK